MNAALAKCFQTCPGDGSVLDVGCLGFKQMQGAHSLGLHGLRHHGVDFSEPEDGVPDGFDFRQCDLDQDGIPFDDDSFDLVIASHVIEHLHDPVGFFGECMRVCRPGGMLYLEAPSDRSALVPSFPFLMKRHLIMSFYDDPTHVSRPWTPQALHRMTAYYDCELIDTHYIVSWMRRLLLPAFFVYALIAGRDEDLVEWVWLAVGWACYVVSRKPTRIRGRPPFSYYIPTGAVGARDQPQSADDENGAAGRQ